MEVSILLLMEMVLEFIYPVMKKISLSGFNPSSNGNGAGMSALITAMMKNIAFQSFF